MERLAVHLEDADRLAARSPHPVEVDAGRHHQDERVVGSDRREIHFLDLHRGEGIALAARPDDAREHLARKHAGLGRNFA